MERREFIKKGFATAAVAALSNRLLASKHKLKTFSYTFNGKLNIDNEEHSLILYLNAYEFTSYKKDNENIVVLELSKINKLEYIKVSYRLDDFVVKDGDTQDTYDVVAKFVNATSHKKGSDALKQLSDKSLIPSYFREKIKFSLLHDSMDFYVDLNISDSAVLSMYDNASIDDCFLTSACVYAKNLPDNCYELQTLRYFRDNFIKSTKEGDYLINQYYKIAPGIVKKINSLENQKDVYEYMYKTLIIPSLKFIEAGENNSAMEYYKEYTMELNKLFVK